MTRFLEPLLQPIGILWALNIVIALRLAYDRKWRATSFFGCTVVLLFAFGSTSIPNRLLASLEQPYSDLQLDRISSADAVVMLGGMLDRSESDSLGFQVGDGFDRAMCAVELIRKRKAPILVIGGGGGHTQATPSEPWTEADLLERWIGIWDLAATNIVRMKLASNTHEEALQVLSLSKKNNWQQIILVTSGYHMKRAEALFRKLEIPVQPVACDFVGLSGLANKSAFSPFPRAGRLHQLDVYLHELIGWYYYKIRGWI